MDLSLGASEARFASEVSEWLAANVETPPEFDDLAEAVEWGRKWQARLAAAGWVGHRLARRVRRQGREPRSRWRCSTRSTRGAGRRNSSTA